MTTGTPGGSGGIPSRWLAAGSVPVFALLMYMNSLGNGFHFDDHHSIIDNFHIRSLANVPQFFIDPGTFSRDAAVAMYRPVLLTTYALNYALAGPSSWGFHLANALLHAVASILVYALLRARVRAPLAWLGAAAFAVHPIHSQAVNYVSTRSELLSAVGVLAAIYLLKVASPPSVRWSAVAYAAGLLAKSTALALLPLLALHEASQPPSRRSWRRLWPFAALSAAYLAAITANGFLTSSVSNLVRPLDHQLYTQAKAVSYYLFLHCMPIGLSIEHGLRTSTTAADWGVAASCALIASLLWLAARDWRSGGQVGFGFLWFAAGLGLTIAMPLNVAVSEHRLYLSSVGGVMAAVIYIKTPVKPAIAWAGLALLFALATLTWERNRIWGDPITLWQDAARRADTARVHSMLGEAYHAGGELPLAIERFEAALAREPDDEVTWLNLGVAHEEQGDVDAAESAYLNSLKLRPHMAEALKNLGRLHMNAGRFREAEATLERSLALDSLYAQTHANLGYLYSLAGRWPEAETRLRAALRLEPGHRKAQHNLCTGYLERALAVADGEQRAGFLTSAERECLALVEGHSAWADGYRSAAAVHEARGADSSAAQLYARAQSLAPDDAQLLAEIGRFEARAGRHLKAAELLTRAIELGDTGALPDLGRAAFAAGEFEGATRAFRRACEMDSTDLASCYNLGQVLVATGETWHSRDRGRAQAAWGEARRSFLKVSASNPGYREVDTRLREVDAKLR